MMFSCKLPYFCDKRAWLCMPVETDLVDNLWMSLKLLSWDAQNWFRLRALPRAPHGSLWRLSLGKGLMRRSGQDRERQKGRRWTGGTGQKNCSKHNCLFCTLPLYIMSAWSHKDNRKLSWVSPRAADWQIEEYLVYYCHYACCCYCCDDDDDYDDGAWLMSASYIHLVFSVIFVSTAECRRAVSICVIVRWTSSSSET